MPQSGPQKGLDFAVMAAKPMSFGIAVSQDLPTVLLVGDGALSRQLLSALSLQEAACKRSGARVSSMDLGDKRLEQGNRLRYASLLIIRWQFRRGGRPS